MTYASFAYCCLTTLFLAFEIVICLLFCLHVCYISISHAKLTIIQINSIHTIIHGIYLVDTFDISQSMWYSPLQSLHSAYRQSDLQHFVEDMCLSYLYLLYTSTASFSDFKYERKSEILFRINALQERNMVMWAAFKDFNTQIRFANKSIIHGFNFKRLFGLIFEPLSYLLVLSSKLIPSVPLLSSDAVRSTGLIAAFYCHTQLKCSLTWSIFCIYSEHFSYVFSSTAEKLN